MFRVNKASASSYVDPSATSSNTPAQVVAEESLTPYTPSFSLGVVHPSLIVSDDLRKRQIASSSASTQHVVDPHSHSKPWEVVVTKMDIEFDADLEKKELTGRAKLQFCRKMPNAQTISLDMKGLDISFVGDSKGRPLNYSIGKDDPLLGSELRIDLPWDDDKIVISYKAARNAEGLYWDLANKVLFSHSQPTYTRSWLPCQDTPVVRTSYTATFKHNSQGISLMSCQNNPQQAIGSAGHVHTMDIPIPSYLIAFAVGDFKFFKTGERTGIFTLSSYMERAKAEYSDLESVLEAAEELMGVYDWGRYDMLILPNGFPASATENPCLSFFSPVMLPGDKSMKWILFHEMAHSWSGNFTTAAGWEHLWLNEGWTTYVENRLSERIMGLEYSKMLLTIDYFDLLEELKHTPPDGQKLRLDLIGKNPRDSFSSVAYYKGRLFLKMLEKHFGREAFDRFMRQYFQAHKHQSVTTEQFEQYLQENLINDSKVAEECKIKEWLYEAGLPDNCPVVTSARIQQVEAIRTEWLSGATIESLKDKTAEFSSHEWILFIQGLNSDGCPRHSLLDKQFGFKDHGNWFVRQAWLKNALTNNYLDVLPQVQDYVVNVNPKPPVVKMFLQKLWETGDSSARAAALNICNEGEKSFYERSKIVVDAFLKERSSL